MNSRHRKRMKQCYWHLQARKQKKQERKRKNIRNMSWHKSAWRNTAVHKYENDRQIEEKSQKKKNQEQKRKIKCHCQRSADDVVYLFSSTACVLARWIGEFAKKKRNKRLSKALNGLNPSKHFSRPCSRVVDCSWYKHRINRCRKNSFANQKTGA